MSAPQQPDRAYPLPGAIDITAFTRLLHTVAEALVASGYPRPTAAGKRSGGRLDDTSSGGRRRGHARAGACARRVPPRGCPMSVEERDVAAHAELAALAVLRLVELRDPAFRSTPELHDAVAALVLAVAAALAAGGAR